jgi:hypothetical protein
MLRLRHLSGLLTLAVLTGAAIDAAAPEQFGAGVTLEAATPLAAVMANPAAFEGRTVRLDGVVTAVCEHEGCWMAFAPADASADATFLVKVDDGVIRFPVSAKGRRASAQGIIERVGPSAEAQAAAREHASHGGASAAAAQPAQWQLKATGAVVY